MERINKAILADATCETYEEIKYHVTSRDKSYFVNPTVEGGRQCGCGAMMFCQGFDVDAFWTLMRDLKPKNPHQVVVAWTTEHGDREEQVMVENFAEGK